MKRGMAEEAAQIRKSLLDHLETGSLHFLLQTASISSDLKVVCLCLMEAAELGTETKTVSKMLKDKTDTSLLLHRPLTFGWRSWRHLVRLDISCLCSSSLQIIKQRL
jgi:hypothetical protein